MLVGILTSFKVFGIRSSNMYMSQEEDLERSYNLTKCFSHLEVCLGRESF